MGDSDINNNCVYYTNPLCVE